jgi:hypothetical protein
VTIGYKLTPDGEEKTFVVSSTAPDGVATGQIRTTVAGLYDVRVLKGGDPIPTTVNGSILSLPVTFQAGDPDAAKTASTWVHSTGRVLNDGTQTHYGTLTVVDAYGNAVEDADVVFDLSVDKAARFTSTANSGDDLTKSITRKSGADGVITVYVASTADETTQINATMGVNGVGTAAFRFGPGAADAGHSTFVVDPQSPATRVADGVQSFEGTLTVRDGSDIVVGGYTATFEVPDGVTISETGPFVTDEHGQVKVHFTSTIAGTYPVNALIGSDKVPALDGTTVDQEIRFVAGPLDLSVSTFDVTTGKVYADGIASHTGTFVARDAQGNVIAGVDVEFGIEQGAASIPGPLLQFASDTPGAVVPAVTGANGVAMVVITSEEPGTFAVTAKVAGSDVLGYADLLEHNRDAQFTAGDPYPGTSFRSVLPDTDQTPTLSVAANGTDPFAITVTVKSAKGILVDGAAVRIVGLDPAVTLVGQASPEETGLPGSDHYGTFTWNATSTTADSFTGQVQVKIDDDWLNVGALVTLNFAATDPVAGNSWLTEPLTGTTAVADDTATLPVSAYVFDAHGNAVQNGSVTFTIPAGTSVGSTSGLNTVVAPINSGVATIDVKSTVAATHLITASVDGNQIMTVKQGTQTVGTDGNAHVTFIHGTADPGSSLLTIPTTVGGTVTKIADGIDFHTAQVLVKDANDNLVRSGTVTFSYSYTDFGGVLRTGDSGPQTIDPATGIASWNFTSLVAKPWTITATIGGVSGNVNPAAGVEAGFRAGDVDPARTVASLQVGRDTAKADGVAVVPAWMTVQDANGNPIAGQYCGFELTDTSNPGAAKFDNAVTGSFEKDNVGPSDGNGRCEVAIRSIYAGAFPVRGVFGNEKTADPLPVARFSNQAVDSGESWFTVAAQPGNSTTPDATANGTDAYIVTVNLRDAAGAIVNNESVDVYYRLTAGGTEYKLTVTSGADGNPAGTATATIQTTTAGLYDVYVKNGFNSIPTTVGGTDYTEQVTFIPGAPDGVRSFLTSAPGTAKANGVATLTVSATVKDANNNVIKYTPVTFTIPADVTSGTTNGLDTVTVNTDEFGVAPLPLTSVKPGTYNITATVGSVDILTGKPATATFVNDDLSLGGSVLELMSTNPQVVGTGIHSVEARLLDAQGNVFTPVRTVTFYAKAPGGSNWEVLGAGNTVNGVVDIAFTKTKAGTWQVRAEVTSAAPQGKIGAGIDGTIVNPEFQAGPADAEHTAATWTGSTGKVLSNNTDTHFAQATVVDQWDNPTTGSVIFTLNPLRDAHFTDVTGIVDLGKGPLTLDATTGNSVLRVYMSSPSNEITSITATLHGDSVIKQDGPSTFWFGPNAATAATSTFVISPAYPATKIADGSDAFTGVVNVRDGSAQPLPVRDYEVSFDLPTDVRIVEAGPYITDVNGELTVHFVSTKADVYTINALVGAANVPVADQQVEFVAGPISFDNSKTFLTVTANGAVANGVATNQVTATLQDQNGNAIKDGFVNFTLPSGVAAVGSPLNVPTDANGVATLDVTSEKAGTPFNITAEARKGTSGSFTGITGGSPAVVTFVPGPAVASASELSVSTGTRVADGASVPESTHTAWVQLKDAFGNDVTTAGLPVRFVFSLAGQTSVTVDTVTDGTGLAQTPYRTMKAGAWSVTATYDANTVGGSPKTVSFVAGPIDLAASTFDVTGGKVASDGLSEHRAWAVVTDKDGNPIADVDVKFTLPAPGSQFNAASVPGPVLGATTGTPGAVVETVARTNGDGLAEVFITSNEPGTFPVSATVGGAPITGNAVSPANREAQFTSGDPDPASSYRTIAPDTDADPSVTLKADNAETFAVTATIKSAFGALVENAAVRLVLPADSPVTLNEGAGMLGELVTGLPTSANYGTFTWHAKSKVVGSYTGQVQVRVGADWFDVGAPVVFNFEAGDPSVGPFDCAPGQTGTSFGFAPSSLEVGDWSTGTVKVTDAFCNPIAGADVTFAKSDGTFQPGTGIVTTGPDGTATIRLTDGVARIDTVSATVAGLSVAVTGTENDVTPATTQDVDFVDTTAPDAPIVDPTDGTEVTGEAEPGTTVKVVDEDGDPIPGCEAVPVGVDGKWACTPDTTIPDGSEITVTTTDDSGNESDPTTVIVDAGEDPDTTAPDAPIVDPTDGTEVTGEAEPGTTIKVVDEDGDPVPGCEAVPVGADGKFACTPDTPLEGGTEITVTATDDAGNESDPTTVIVDEVVTPGTLPPDAPIVDPTNGTEVTGEAEPGTTIKVVDEDGDPIPGCEAVPVGADGKFACTPDTTIPDGTEITVTATDPDGNVSAPTKVTVGAIGITLSKTKLYRGEQLGMHGFNFIPSEKVTVICNSSPVNLGTFTAEKDGQVSVPDWTIPADFELGQHICTFTGEKSGPVSAPFQVIELVRASTGGSSTEEQTPDTAEAVHGFVAAVLRKRKLV